MQHNIKHATIDTKENQGVAGTGQGVAWLTTYATKKLACNQKWESSKRIVHGLQPS